MDLERVESRAQIAAVAALARETWTQHYGPLIGAAQVEYMLAKFQSAEAIARQIAAEGYEYYLAPDAGYLALVPDRARQSAMLSKIYVRSSRRGTGLGRAMVDFAEKRAAELGGAELWLTVNKRNAGSIAFYERMGFLRTEALVTDIGGATAWAEVSALSRMPRRSAIGLEWVTSPDRRITLPPSQSSPVRWP